MLQDSTTPVTDLRNFGAVTAQRLAEIHIHTLADIEALGAVETFARLHFMFGNAVGRNALHALEATLRDLDWRDLPVEVKAWLDAEAEARVGFTPAQAAA